MTATRLADVISPTLWTPAFIMADPVFTNFFKSGIASVDPLMAQYAASEASSVNIRWLKPMDGTQQENISSDDPAALSTPNGAGVASMSAAKLFRNNSWASMDLTAALFTPDPVAAMRSQVAGYWVHRYQAYIISVCAGVTASNVAANAGDMVYDATLRVGNDGNGNPLANMSADNILQAKQTMGDHASSLGIIAMHSVVHTNLQRQNLIQYLRNSDATIITHTYLNYIVVVDDQMPIVGEGGITAINVVTGGTYTSAPAVAIGAPDQTGGIQATATAIYAGGTVTGFTVTNPGAGYSVAPAITLSGGGQTVQGTATAVINTTGYVYTSYMYAPGFIRWGTGTPKVPSELFRTPAAGNGEGEETFYNRQHWIGHPTGFNYSLQNAGAPQFNPTNTQLATAPAWTRVWTRKQVPFVAIKTKG